jgi:hypothetical protein
MDLANSPATVERASQLLREINLLYGVVSGVMLKYSFDWSAETEKYDKSRSWLAVALALGSLLFASVLVSLMGDVAIDSMRNNGSIEPTLVIFLMVFILVIVLVAVSLVALGRAVIHLTKVLK